MFIFNFVCLNLNLNLKSDEGMMDEWEGRYAIEGLLPVREFCGGGTDRSCRGFSNRP